MGDGVKILAVIPARGGSKSIPRKNLLMLAGKPLIAHSIGQALTSSRITRTIVSTDDDEIARVARDYGAEVPFTRPAELAQDASPDIGVFTHALQWLSDHEDYHCDIVVHLRPTGPVRRVSRIDQAIELFMQHPAADSLRSVSLALQTPYKMWRVIDGMLQPVVRIAEVESYCLPRQALPDVYWQNGYVDLIRPHVILRHGQMCGDTILPFVVEEPIYELDYPEDVVRVEAALHAIERGEAAAAPRRSARHAV